MLRYPIELTKDDNDTFLVTCPDLPEVTTFAESFDEAETRASAAIEEAVAARAAGGVDIPEPSRGGEHSAAVGTHTELKIVLHRRLRMDGITRAELQRRLGWQRESVDRLFRFYHASRLDQIDAALKAMGEEVRIVTESVK